MDSVMDSGAGGWLCGWFDDCNLEDINRSEAFQFISWAFFEYRSPEHLSDAELQQLISFVNELEWRISIYLFGLSLDDQNSTERKLLVWSDDPSLRCNPREGKDEPLFSLSFPYHIKYDF